MRTYDTLIVGMGCAGLKCADELNRLGMRDFAILTDDCMLGTSRNAGSDKQTYYKLTLSGFDGDSVGEMAQTLFDGGCVDGPNALCEAALSAPCFLRLCDLGVPFPTNEYGEYIGYRTDHDPRRRATSAGPLTSKSMTEALEKSVRDAGTVILSGYLALKIVIREGRVCGLVCLNTKDNAFEAFSCRHIVWATGGPANVYESVVYPIGQAGMSGAPFEAGAVGVNLTEWQYGLASVQPRWNVSGTYMQVLPRFISTAQDGSDAREFLLGSFADVGDALTHVFLKGYQWPFDARKAKDGSSRVDLAVLSELRKDRRVFLDFTQNPFGDVFSFDVLSSEAHEYLSRAGALFGTPIERLMHMNAPAVQFYAGHGVDLSSQWLEISLCAQHMNGGIGVNEWWETSVSGLFAVGECAGTHGVYRPGGSALNAGQVGGARSARRIVHDQDGSVQAFDEDAEIALFTDSLARCRCAAGGNVKEIIRSTTHLMSLYAAAERDCVQIEKMYAEMLALRMNFWNVVRYSDVGELAMLFRLYDTLLTQVLILGSMKAHVAGGGGNRGSAVYAGMEEKAEDVLRGQILEARWNAQVPFFRHRPVKPIPQEDDFFENVWKRFRENRY